MQIINSGGRSPENSFVTICLYTDAKKCAMDFRFYFPKKLKKAVRVIWEQKCNTPTKWQILPSGFTELIFRLGAPGFDDFSAKKLNLESDPSKHFCFLSGLHTRPLYITFSRFHFMGIQLKPVALPSFFEIPCKEFLDEAIEGDLLINRVQYIEEHLQIVFRREHVGLKIICSKILQGTMD